MREIDEQEFTKKWADIILDRISVSMRLFVKSGADPENESLFERSRRSFIECKEYVEAIESVLADILDIKDACDIISIIYGKDSVEYSLVFHTILLMWGYESHLDYDPENAAICGEKDILDYLDRTAPRKNRN